MEGLNWNMEYVERIAKVCHEANKAYCETIGDSSQKHWDDAEQWQRDSSIRGVLFTLNNHDTTAEDQHNAWMSDKVKDGWVYGEVKDTEKKTHPCMVPYLDLPVDQRKKDHLFRNIIKAIG